MRNRRRLAVFGLALAGLVMGSGGEANAIVVQINGQICPQTPGNLQTGLNRGENGCPNPANMATCYANGATPADNAGAPGSQGAIDPVLEAGVDPQVFAIPKTGANFNTVDFVFLWRGNAGFRNTFGWYNVGDDLTNLANLHTVITCNPNTDPPPSATMWEKKVDFQAELAAGRYNGGFVGFFLVTPEGQSGTCTTANCGRPDSAACVGRIYYTERQINGDGNYVHYLVYQSKVLDAQKKRANDYYFGFEDLYRGGDNDFKDVTMLVKGLVVPCSPQPEVCDGKDNNCDGLIDNNPVDANIACNPDLAGGVPNPAGVGECKAGLWECLPQTPPDLTTDQLVCVGQVTPVVESCNGKDDDCDTMVDDPANGVWMPALSNACPNFQGTCMGSTQCVAGKPQCVENPGPTPEVCNGLDDNCNGKIDDNTSDEGQSCTPCDLTVPPTSNCPTVGACKKGKTVCSPGGSASDALTCAGYVGPSAELCDGIDNDCNGKVDDNPTDLAAMCTPAGVKVCGSGHETCLNGAKVCVGFTFPAPEKCNGIDDDCNGTIDDKTIDTGTSCVDPVTAPCGGITVCAPVTMGDPTTDTIQCLSTKSPSPEICNGLDDNCNGLVDENPDTLPGVGDDCSTMCGMGKQICKDGKLQCAGTSGGTAEVCNGKDDDCNKLIDDNPSDVGGPCGDVVVDPKIQKPGVCVQGTFQCLPTKPGDLTTDMLQCAGEKSGSPEVCNGLDDNCNGIVDENIPGDGADCVPDGLPPGTTLPLKGVCKPGKLLCMNGKQTCIGGIGPQPEQCDMLDHNCDGMVDSSDNGCASPNKCIDFTCKAPCKVTGEFDPCPIGQHCSSGFCTVTDCTKSCGAGLMCQKETGVCVPIGGAGGSGGSGGSTGSVGGSSAGGSGAVGGNATSAGGSAAHGGTSAGGTSSSQGGNNATGTGGTGTSTATGTGGTQVGDRFELTTGGGGCAVATPARENGPWSVAVLGVLAWLERRRRARKAKAAASLREVAR